MDTPTRAQGSTNQLSSWTLAEFFTSLGGTQKLPNETLAEIFVWCSSVDYTGTPPFQVKDYFQQLPIWKHNLAPLKLCHVCRRWRKVAMDLGKLWSCFSLDVRLPGAYHQAKQWLRRSKGHLLTLRWHRIQVIASDKNMVRRIMYGLSGAGDALKTFRVVSESGSVTENVQNLASCDFSCNSQMRSLSIHSLGNQSIKSITSTSLRMIQLFSSPTTVQDVYRFLTGCPELKHFSVDLIVPSELFRHGGGMKAYTHSRLAYFGLGSTHTRSMTTPGVEPTPYCDGLLESLRFPSLNSIKFWVPDSTTSILRSLSSLIENSFSNHPADSFSPLRRLIVFSFHESQRLLSNLNDEDWRTFAQALSLTPHLERLAIHAPVCEGFVKSLTIRGSPELAPNICPRLKGVDLCIDMCPELTLQEMLQSRSMAPMASAYPGLG